jgi:hypothetical protein
VLAQYIDNDEDGIPDDPTVLAHLVNNNFVVPVWSTSDRTDFWEQARGTYCEENTGMAASMYYDEDKWAIGGINKAGTWDTNLEEVWHVVSVGWYAAYPEYFGDGTSDTNEVTPSKLTDAMDAARGGQFVATPTIYPKNAWYAYTDQSCRYGCQVHEYFYWILMSNLGALDPSITSKCEQSAHEWNVCTRAQLEQTDVMAFNLLNDNSFALPQNIPDGTYRNNGNSEYDGSGLLGDFDGNNSVDFSDFLTFAAAFGSTSSDPKYVARADLNASGTIDFTDFLSFAAQFGKSLSAGN